MILQDFHVHSSFCDGHDTPTDIAKAAYEMGIEKLGICAHSDTFFDRSYCLKESDYPRFQKEIANLKAEYEGKMQIFCGIEQDYYACASTAGFDYVIGSVHYLKCGEDYIPVDESAQILRDAANRYFQGDIYALAQAYYHTVSDVVTKTQCDIIGHFDLISKFNEGASLFDDTDSRYVKAYRFALDALLPSGIPFEVNTGAISRGYRTSPYPSDAMRSYIVSHGGKLLLSSDSHAKETLCFQFDKWN